MLGHWSLGSTQQHRLGGGKSRVAGEDTPQLLRERSPTPEPPVTRGAPARLVASVSSVAESRLDRSMQRCQAAVAGGGPVKDRG
jgi:hypothetical protein